jgi:glutamate-ammonia-ligase adenylyltransferase
MTADELRTYLDSAVLAEPVLRAWGLRDPQRGQRNLVAIAELGVPLSLLAVLAGHLVRLLPPCADPDMALNNLERYFAGTTSPLSAAAFMERDPAALDVLVQLFSTSQYFSDLLTAAPQYFEWLRTGVPGARRTAVLRDELSAEIRALPDNEIRLNAIRRFKQQELLRIGYADIVRGAPLELVTQQISELADAVVGVALELSTARHMERHGTPRGPEGVPGRFAVLGMGKLGGNELNYSSDIDLVFLYDADGMTDGRRPIANEEYWASVARDMTRALSVHTERGHAYRVDLRLRPEGERGPVARTLASTLAYYDTLGRTWERQALIKARPIAGDTALGEEFLRRIEPFVYRRYLTFAEINEIKALKRRIESKSRSGGDLPRDVKTGTGGIRDVEYVVQFLQLLNGGALPELRERNTLRAIAALERCGCLTIRERMALEGTYRFLRQVEHRLQTMFNQQTHALPESSDELERLARRMGYEPSGDGRTDSARERFCSDFRAKAQRNRDILNHLLHDTFADAEAGTTEPEADLLLDPDPTPETIERVLGGYPFRDRQRAYEALVELAREPVPFLSTPRCRQFLASIAPRLLRELAAAPDPDRAMANLEKITASLGARGVLWELFSHNPPSLRLCVELCAWSQFLSEILITNPGMIDELLDSLVLNQPRELAELRGELDELCRAAEDVTPILHSFKNKEQLRVGVRDILGKDSVEATTAALSDIAEVILGKVVEREYVRLCERLGVPHLEDGPHAGRPSRLAVLALGKFGGRELNYHSDLDVVFLYEGDGATRLHGRRRGWEPTTNFHFFSELGQQIMTTAGRLEAQGRLYQIDPRLRPTGRSGSLVLPLDQFCRYYESGTAALWERQALTRSRVVYGESEFAAPVAAAADAAAYGLAWKPQFASEILQTRHRLEESRSETDLKRGFGGIVDIEFVVQCLLLKHGPTSPGLRTPNTWQALDRLQAAGHLDGPTFEQLRSCYRFLRRVESRLRIVHNVARDELPHEPDDQAKLARRLEYADSPHHTAREAFLAECHEVTTRTRQIFLEIMQRESA